MNRVLQRIYTALFFSFFISLSVLAAEDILVFQADHQNRVVIHGANGENQSLYFGDSLSQALHWDSFNDSFVFTDDVDFGDNEIKNVRLENLASAPICDASVIGKIYYDTTEGIPYSCDGVDWKKLATNIENAVVKPALIGFSGGSILEDGTTEYAFNAQSSRTTTGQYTITFDSVHPNGNLYNIALSLQQDSPNRDHRKIQWGNKTSSSFDVFITVDDNGTTADIYADEKFDFTVFSQENIIISE